MDMQRGNMPRDDRGDRKHRRRNNNRYCVLVLLILSSFSGCATQTTETKQGPIFYPPLPNPPRIQHLASFSKSRDLGANVGVFGRFILGKPSQEADLIQKPYGVALHKGKIYVVDTRGPGYVMLDLANNKHRRVSGSGAGRMQKPINITIDTDGNKYITDTDRNQVLVFDPGERYLRAYGVEGQFKPGDVVVSGDKIYVSDLKHHQIQVLDKRTGKLLHKFAKAGTGKGDLFYPTNLELAPDGYLYVSDTGNYRLQKYTLDGKFIQSFGSVGTGIGHFARPKGVAVDREGRIYAVDAAFENVQVLDDKGRLLLFFGEAGDKPDSLNLPTDIIVDYDNVQYFQRYAHPQFKLEYVILVASQFGVNKINAFGYGRMVDMDYTTDDQVEVTP